jgi:hypothetical protein
VAGEEGVVHFHNEFGPDQSPLFFGVAHDLLFIDIFAKSLGFNRLE